MKKLLFVAVLLMLAESAQAQVVVSCSLSGLTPAQTQLVADFVAEKNAEGGGEAPYADWPAYCSWRMRSDVLGYVQHRAAERLRRIGLAVTTNGNDVAPTAQCTAAGVAAGCKKSEVACWVLTGSAVCN